MIPIPWRAHSGSGRKSFNPLFKERKQVQWLIKEQCDVIGSSLPRFEGAIRCEYNYYMPIPKSTSKKRRALMISGEIRPTTRPDCTNIQKFYEDCLNDFLFDDDSQVVDVHSRKWYGEIPRVVIKITELKE